MQRNITPVVIVGTALDPRKETLWGIIEKQLDGSNTALAGNIAPGREALRGLLARHQPVLILMDEILEYTTRASGIPVGETSLAGADPGLHARADRGRKHFE